MSDRYKFAVVLLKAFLSFVCIYIISSYAGYELYGYTHSLISSNLLPKDVWYWIIVKCCFYGVMLPILIIGDFYFVIYLIYCFVNYKIRLSQKFSLLNKLHNYIYLDLTSNEKSIIINLQNKDYQNKLIYEKILNNCILSKYDAQLISACLRWNCKLLKNKKDLKLCQSIRAKLLSKSKLKLDEKNIKNLLWDKGLYVKYSSLIKLLCLNQVKDEHKFQLSLFIDNKDVRRALQSPIEKIIDIVSIDEINTLFGMSISCVILSLAICILNYNIFISHIPFGEILLLLIMFLIIYIVENRSIYNIIFQSILIAICFTLSIITVTPSVIVADSVIQKSFIQIKEVDNKIITNLIVDSNILKQIELWHFDIIQHCHEQEFNFCYDAYKYDALTTNLTESKILSNTNYFQLKNFRVLYLLTLSESSNAYLIDANNRMFNLSIYGNYYILPVKNTSNNKVENHEKKSYDVNKSCTIVPSYSAMLSLYRESEFHQKCMHYISDESENINGIVPFSKSTSCM